MKDIRVQHGHAEPSLHDVAEACVIVGAKQEYRCCESAEKKGNTRQDLRGASLEAVLLSLLAGARCPITECGHPDEKRQREDFGEPTCGSQAERKSHQQQTPLSQCFVYR